jgi:uncharacterized cupin superfamily protein
MSTDKPHPLIKAAEIEEMPLDTRTHQFNSNAIRQTRSLGDLLGLEALGVHLVTVEPGNESTQFHFHHVDEEFLYILSGRGIAEIGEDSFEVEPGDFMGFTAHSLPHTLVNPYKEDLTYLMAGSRSHIDICDYPRIRRRMYRANGKKEFVDWDSLNKV